MSRVRIGVLGGTFDPVHRGHFQLALHAQKEVNLHRVLFVPAAQPPHKYTVFTCFAHRLKMLELHCAGRDDLQCTGIEESLSKPSYTVDTLAAMQGIYEDADLFFILGADAFLDLMSWKAYPEILTKIQFVISPREGYRNKELYEFLYSLGYKAAGSIWRSDDSKKDIFLLSTIPEDVSSQQVRALLESDGEVAHLLHPDVLRYIRENGLYSS